MRIVYLLRHLRSLVVRPFDQHRKGVDLIPAERHVVHEIFVTVP